MAEAIAVVGLAASVLTFADVSAKVLARLREFHASHGGVARVFQDLRAQLPFISEIMSRITRQSSDSSLSVGVEELLQSVVEGCVRQIQLLENIIEQITPNPKDSRLQRTRKAFASVRKEREIRLIHEALESYKTTLTLFFSQNVWAPIPTVPPQKTYQNIPALQVSQFVNREHLMDEINLSFAGYENNGSPKKAVVLLGMGGSGKTQLALRFCWSLADRIKAILWMDGSSPDSFARSLEQVSDSLGGGKRVFSNSASRRSFVTETLCELRSPWLMILDNLDQPETLKTIQEWFPTAPGGLILVTSRHTDVGRMGSVVRVVGMNEAEALELLLDKPLMEVGAEDLAAGKQVVETLGYLPLAIDQTKAYVSSRSLPLRLFGKHYAERREAILKHSPRLWEYRKNLTDKEDQTSMSSFTTWELSYHELGSVEDERAKYGHFLTLSAFLDSSRLTADIFRPYIDSKPDLLPWMSLLTTDGHWDQIRFEDAIAELSSLSLIQAVEYVDLDVQFSLHPLIREWARLRVPKGDRIIYVTEAMTAITNGIAATSEHAMPLAMRQNLLAHIYACLQNLDDLEGKAKFQAEFLQKYAHRFAYFYNCQGRYRDAASLYDEVFQSRKDQYGFGHPSTIRAAMNLANAYDNNGWFEKAMSLYSLVLDSQVVRLGETHIDTLRVVEAMAKVNGNQGDYNEAELKYERVFMGHQRLLGVDHIVTLRTAEGLANVYRRQDRYSEAEAILSCVLRKFEAATGQDHPDTLRVAQSLAVAYRLIGRYSEAEGLYQYVLAVYEKTYGPDHPHTLRIIMNLAVAIAFQGRYKDAEVLNIKAFNGHETLLGLDHIYTFRAGMNLATTYRKLEKTRSARALYSRLLTETKERRGSDYRSLQWIAQGRRASDLYCYDNSFHIQFEYTEPEQYEFTDPERWFAWDNAMTGPENTPRPSSYHSLFNPDESSSGSLGEGGVTGDGCLHLPDSKHSTLELRGQSRETFAPEIGDHESTIRILVGHFGLPPNSVDRKGSSLLYREACNGQENVVAFLLEKGADVNLGNRSPTEVLQQYYPLIGATESNHLQVVRLLIENDADVNVRNRDRESALYVAVKAGHAAVLSFLLSQPAIKVDLKDGGGRTVFFEAVRRGNTELVGMLLRQESISRDLLDYRACLAKAASRGFHEIVKLMLDHAAQLSVLDSALKGTPLLELAACSGNLETFRLLADRFSAALRADREGNLVAKAAVGGNVAIFRLLLDEYGMAADQRDEFDDAPLFHAVNRNNVELVEYLLQREDVDPNHEGSGGAALCCAVGPLGSARSVDIVRLFLDQDRVKANPRGRWGRTPLQAAALFGAVEICRLLLARRGDDGEGEGDNNIDVNARDTRLGRTALAAAADALDKDSAARIVELLLARSSISADAADHEGDTALTLAAGQDNVSVVRQLVARRDVDINHRGPAGATALVRAAQSCSDAAYAALLEAGADVNVVDDNGRDAAWYRRKHSAPEKQ